MDRIRKGLSALPPCLLSILTFIAILWLTLAPKPLGEEMPPLFEGADKIAHAIMFGGFAVMMLLDWQRKHGWRQEDVARGMIYAFISSATGALVEVAQAAMGMGRGFEYGDIIADTIGAFIFAALYLSLQKYWLRIS